MESQEQLFFFNFDAMAEKIETDLSGYHLILIAALLYLAILYITLLTTVLTTVLLPC
jgi:hypothetical protein